MSDGYVNLPVSGGGSSGVPYTGATQDLDLGNNALIAGETSTTFSTARVSVLGEFPLIAQFGNIHGAAIDLSIAPQTNTDINAEGLYVQLQDLNGTTNTVGGYFSAAFDTTTYSHGNDINYGLGNFGAQGLAQGSGPGLGVGLLGYANAYAVSVGIIGQSGVGNATDNSINVGVMGYGANVGAAASNIGGHFFLDQVDSVGGSYPYNPPATTTALLADNKGIPTANIAEFYSAGVPALYIDPNGFVMGSTDGVLQIGAYDGSEYTNRFKSIYVTNHVGRDGNSYFDFNTLSGTSGILVVSAGQGSWAFVNPYPGNFDIQSQQGDGDYANITWSTDGTSGDIGATNNGAVMQRPRNIYAAQSVIVGNALGSPSQVVVATTGGSATATGQNIILEVAAAGTIATYGVTTPANPIDGQILRVLIVGLISALTLTANSGQAINNNSVVTVGSTGGATAPSASWTYTTSGGNLWTRNY